MQKGIKFICLIFLLIIGFVLGCPIKNIFNVTCPACGVTHAWIYLFQGKFSAAFKSNFLFLPLTILFLKFFYSDVQRQSLKGIELAFYVSIAIFAFCFNVYRILIGL